MVQQGRQQKSMQKAGIRFSEIKVDAIKKIEKVIISCQTLNQLEMAVKMLELGYDQGLFDWFELRRFYKLVNSVKLKVACNDCEFFDSES